MSVSDPFLRRPVLTLVVTVLILLAGLISLPALQVENLPPIAPIRVNVRASYPGGGAAAVEQGVTTPLERQLNGLERLESIRSSSSANGSSITLTFEGGNPELNQINAQNEATLANRQLPPQVSRLGVQVRRSSDDLLMVLGFSAPKGVYAPAFLSGWVDQQLRDTLQRVPGVGNITVAGGGELAFRLWLDPVALEQRQLTIADVERALVEQNVLAALGQVGDAPSPPGQQTTLPLEMEGRLRSVIELEGLVVSRTSEGSVVLLKDVGRVTLDLENFESTASNLAGDPVVAVQIFQRDGSNALEVSDAVNSALERLQSQFPPGLDVQRIVDVADSVRESIDLTQASLRDAVILVLLVLLLALGNSRLAVVTAVAVPVALIGSLSILWVTGNSINTLSIFGMVLATGLVVDDAIVVSEDIGRRLELGESPQQAAREAMKELGGAVIATSLVLVVVFLPVLAMPGSVGRLYQPIALTISATILFSTINALTFTPVASAWLLTHGWREPARLQKLMQRPQIWLEQLGHHYGRALDRSFRYRRLVLLGLAGGLMLAVWGLGQLPTGFIPQEDDGQIRGVVALPGGASIQATATVMERIRESVAKEPTVRVANFYAGRSFGDNSPNRGLFFIRLKELSERGLSRANSNAAVARRLGEQLRREITEAAVQVSVPPAVRGFSGEGGLELEILDVSSGRLTLAAFEQEARRFIAIANADPAFERVSTRFSADSPLLRLRPDRMRMASLGVDLSTLVETLGSSFGSRYVNDSFESDRVRRVVVQLDGNSRSSAADVLALQVRSRAGDLIPLSAVVAIEQDTGPTTINHSRLSRSITIQAIPRSGLSTGQAIARLEAIQQEQANPLTDLEWVGLAREERQAGGKTWQLFAFGMVVVYLVLAGLYESFLDPLIILITVPLALLGALIGLAGRGLFLDIYAQVGLLVLVSLSAKNGILIVEFANQQLKQGIGLREAIEHAAISRLRPILLTAISSLVGFLPLVFATGAGSASRISIGTVVFSGLLTATLLTLFVVPVVYLEMKLIEGRKWWPHRQPS
ncbi:efflux RND transporter permease subunit [Synechococcus sp. CS-1324]|uniref:efflux RND transporter permease subunit n=1 Tax=Synechococcus sp. CS-1324 TaxID=2847980 RepID=UPI000DB331E4|nr:efflux RND transporter permease subunit [Synechococcus sp. CS-1324]MCT0229272.1 efflux RND transporter permease subunit [Synechococcus sp. CS-1324]PZV06271.1 MAG: RND transporter [Cyanobium sp.]